jgi:hypothetical protein
MRHLVISVVLLVLQIAVVAEKSFGQIMLQDTTTSKGLHHHQVSLISIIANPERYDGFYVQVTGYLHLRSEDFGLYLSKTDGDYLNGKNAVWVSFAQNVRKVPIVLLGQKDTSNSIQYFDGKYVTMTGVFDKSHMGHMGTYSGTLRDIDSIVEDRKWYDGRQDLWKDKMDGRGLRLILPDASKE